MYQVEDFLEVRVGDWLRVKWRKADMPKKAHQSPIAEGIVAAVYPRYLVIKTRRGYTTTLHYSDLLCKNVVVKHYRRG